MPLSRKSIRSRRDFLLKIVIAAVLVGAVIAILRWYFFARDWVTTDNAYVAGNIIPVQADATEVVAAVLAEETQFVKKDAVLVRLDGQRARAALAQAEAELGRAVRAVGALYALRRQVCQKVVARAALRDRTRHDLARYRQATASGASSRQVLQNAEDQLAALEADLREAQAEYQAVEARVGGVTRMSHPDIEAAKARYNDAYIEFLRQNIRAPASGYVAKRGVQVGKRVRPGDVVLNIVPLDHLWVRANLWENRMDRVRPGQPAIIRSTSTDRNRSTTAKSLNSFRAPAPSSQLFPPITPPATSFKSFNAFRCKSPCRRTNSRNSPCVPACRRSPRSMYLARCNGQSLDREDDDERISDQCI